MRALQFGGKPIELNPARGYNCFAKETEFVTSLGVFSFADFKDGDEISVLTHLGNWKKAKVRNYGKQKLQKISFSRGNSKVREIFATKNHRWILSNNENTTSLSVNDKVLAAPNIFDSFRYEQANPLERLYWAYGYVFGDGTVCKDEQGKPKYSMVRVCGADKAKFAYRFEELGFSSSQSASLGEDIIFYTGKYLKTIPDLTKDNPDLIKAFVCGYLDADAEKINDTTMLSKYRSILSADTLHQSVIEDILPVAGVFVSSERYLGEQETNFGKRNKNTKHYGISTNLTNKTNMQWSVKEIDQTDRSEDVWCLEVEDDHSFVLSCGISTGNCAFMHADDWHFFPELMFLLLGGSGVGYSVQKHHVSKLPEVKKPLKKKKRHLVGDSIEGWSDAIKVLVKAYFLGEADPVFDFSDIRTKGTLLKTSGGRAPGPQPLKDCIHNLRKILDAVDAGDKLTPLQVHDMACFIADAVLSGGIRRAAMLALFSLQDEAMLSCKFGNWWELNPQRARANNSVCVLRHKVNKKQFFSLWEKIEASKAGEPGIIFSNNAEWGMNPCAEIALRSNQFCNLTTINVSNIESQEDFNARAKAASFIGTLQASYTDFHYLRDIWRETTEKEALIGVSQTGIAVGEVLKYNLTEAAEIVVAENQRVAKLIGINPAARATALKPEGTGTLVAKAISSGIGACHNDFWIKAMRANKMEALWKHFAEKFPKLVEDDFFKPTTDGIINFPMKAPKGAILRHEPVMDFLERIKKFSIEWVKPGHIKGDNTHNVSATINIKDDEWEMVGEWMWENRDHYSGLSVLPFDGR